MTPKPKFVAYFSCLFLFFFISTLDLIASQQKVFLGADLLFLNENRPLIKGKRIGLITNHTAINGQKLSTIDLFKAQAKSYDFTLVALFAPEHGLTGAAHANELVEDQRDQDGIPIYSLHGKLQRPTSQMLEKLDLLIYDIQDIGSRSYTYVTTLFYVMEEAAKKKLPILVLDRPNPINGVVVDGPMLEDQWRSIVGYINVPYCHGMTVGELALLFNQEYKIGCPLKVIPMKGWKRRMSFAETGLAWIPTSPHVPEASTAMYYPITGLLGELSIVNIGVGYTLPFKLVGAPWIDAQQFARVLNAQKFPGVRFIPFHFKPFYGKFAKELCQGVLIDIEDPLLYQPISTQYLIIGILKSLYPSEFKKAINSSKDRKNMFCKVNGTEEVYRLISEESNIVWKLRAFNQKSRHQFLETRRKYLIPAYSDD